MQEVKEGKGRERPTETFKCRVDDNSSLKVDFHFIYRERERQLIYSPADMIRSFIHPSIVVVGPIHSAGGTIILM